MENKSPFLPVTLALSLVLLPVATQVRAAGKDEPAGRKVTVEGYILSVEDGRMLVGDTWVCLPEDVKIRRKGCAWIEPAELHKGLEVTVKGWQEDGAQEVRAAKVHVDTARNAKVKLSGILEIEGQGWEDFSLPEVRWTGRVADEDGDMADEGPERFAGLRERPLAVQGRRIVLTDDTEFIGNNAGATIPFRLFYPGMLVECTGRVDETTGFIEVKTLRARYEGPDPLEYQVRQESQLEIAKLEPGIMLYTDPAVLRWIADIGERLIPPYAYLGHNPPDFNFQVLATEEPISFGMPNGTIYVSAGLMCLLDSEEELAAVLAHEIAHVCLRHVYRALDQKQRISVIDLGTFAGTIAFGPLVSILGPMLKVATYKGLRVVTFAIAHGYQDPLEAEADFYAADFLSHGGYDPGALLRLADTLSGVAEAQGQPGTNEHAFFWCSQERWDRRLAELRCDIALRYPTALSCTPHDDPNYRAKTRHLAGLLAEKLEGQGQQQDAYTTRLLAISTSRAQTTKTE